MEKMWLGNMGDGSKNFKLSKKSKTGILLSLCLAVGIGSYVGINSGKDDENLGNVVPIVILEEPAEPSINEDYLFENEENIIFEQSIINTSLDDINSLNITINDDNCMGDFMYSVCQQLDNDGIKYSFTSDDEDISVNDSVVITLDQQYMAGPGTVVFAPYKNGGNNDSDALALSAQAAFCHNGFLMDNIACGQFGFRENEDGSISERVPTSTEDIVGTNNSTSYVTISFGTNNIDASMVAKSIEETLARYCSYISSRDSYADLIYCVESGDDYDSISNKLGIDANRLDEFNDTIDESMLLTGETIINPVVQKINEFNKNTSVSVTTNINSSKKQM